MPVMGIVREHFAFAPERDMARHTTTLALPNRLYG